jgi:hypothetical protein
MNTGIDWIGLSLMAFSLIGVAAMIVWLFGKPREKDRR